jgi:hypothetical protein
MRNTFSKRWRVLLASAALIGATICPKSSVFAGSDKSEDTYAGDVNAIALPEGTFIFLQYFKYIHGDSFINTPDSLLTKIPTAFGLPQNPRQLPANIEIFQGITRVAYFSSLWDHPLVLEAAVPYAWFQDVNIGNQPVFNPTTGLGPQTKTNGVADPVIFFDYGLIVEPKNERFLDFSNFFYLPLGEFNKFNAFNASSPHQFTWVPEIQYAEGLEKFSPSLKSFWIDVIANASIHSDGDPNFAIAGVGQFNNLTRDNSYDIKAFLRYVYTQGGLLAVGIEKSWGGNQIMSGGQLGAIFGPTLFLKDDFLKGTFRRSFLSPPIFTLARTSPTISNEKAFSGKTLRLSFG